MLRVPDQSLEDRAILDDIDDLILWKFYVNIFIRSVSRRGVSRMGLLGGCWELLTLHIEDRVILKRYGFTCWTLEIMSRRFVSLSLLLAEIWGVLLWLQRNRQTLEELNTEVCILLLDRNVHYVEDPFWQFLINILMWMSSKEVQLKILPGKYGWLTIF